MHTFQPAAPHQEACTTSELLPHQLFFTSSEADYILHTTAPLPCLKRKFLDGTSPTCGTNSHFHYGSEVPKRYRSSPEDSPGSEYSETFAASFLSSSSLHALEQGLDSPQHTCDNVLLCDEAFASTEALPIDCGLSPWPVEGCDFGSPAISGLDCSAHWAAEDVYGPCAADTCNLAVGLPKLQCVVPEVNTVAALYGFSAYSTQLGSSYLTRLMARDPCLQRAVDCTPAYQHFLGHQAAELCLLHSGAAAPMQHQCPADEEWVLAVHLTCIYLAAKMVEQLPYKRMLQTMLSHVYGRNVSSDEASALELNCLLGLDWRLGPFFQGDF